MKFCTNCGNQLGSEKFCTKCGAPVQDSASAGTTGNSHSTNLYRGNAGTNVVYAQRTNSTTIMVILGGAALAVIIAVVIICINLFGGRSYKALTKSYINAMFDGDAEKIVELMPDALADYAAREQYDGDKKRMIDDLETELDDYLEQLEEDGFDTSDISYKIVDIEKASGSSVKDFQEGLDDEGVKVKLRAARRVKVEITDGDHERTMYIVVVKVGLSWYLMSPSI